MTKSECEQIQENIMIGMDDQPDVLVDKMCQVVVDYFNQQIEKDEILKNEKILGKQKTLETLVLELGTKIGKYVCSYNNSDELEVMYFYYDYFGNVFQLENDGESIAVFCGLKDEFIKKVKQEKNPSMILFEGI